MPTPFEAEISALLSNTSDTSAVADVLVGRWRQNLLSEGEQIDCAQFLLSIGQISLLFGEIERLIEDMSPVPWAQFAEGLGRESVLLNEVEAQAVLEACAYQNGFRELVKSRKLDNVNPQFEEQIAKRRREVAALVQQEIQDKKQMLRDKLSYLRTNRMIDQELEALEEFDAHFPNDREARTAKEALHLRWARDLVAKSSAAQETVQDLEWKNEILPQDQLAAKNLIIAHALNTAAADGDLAYDLAVSLHVMDFHVEALEVLDLAHPSFAVDWLRVELLLAARQFVTALEVCDQLELAYATDPETSFTVTYARARALRGLGQVNLAIDLLRSLVNLRPNYKSAQSFLLDWSGGEV